MCDIQKNISEIKNNSTSIKFFVAGGIPYYLKLMSYFRVKAANWKNLFNEFYKIQGLGDQSRNRIFEEFENCRPKDFNRQTLNNFLNRIRDITGRIEISFISKLLHTYTPDRYIIYDKYVTAFFACNPQRHPNKADLYFNLNEQYSQVNELSCIFDNLFPDKNITDYKKIDFMIWGWGKWKAFEDKYPSQDR